jgi:hypothetical protein
VALLDIARKAGLFRDPALRKQVLEHPNLEALRDRADFRRVLSPP